MKQDFDDFSEDDAFAPCLMLISEGVLKEGVPTTLYQINVECDLGEDFEEIVEEFGLEYSGYTLESVALAFVQSEQEDLLEFIDGYDTESTTFVIYMVSEESMRTLAKRLQKLFTDAPFFRKMIKQNLGFVRDRYS